jgi:long-chain acyl-CoA synthetase
LIGSGHRSLGALIVPDEDALSAQQGKPIEDFDMGSINNLLFEAVQEACKTRAPWEKVSAISVIDKPFCFQDGTLTRTMKPRRPNIMQKYAHQVEELERRLR